MNKTIRRNVVVSAILAIMLCVSLIAGATFALFTSESKVNIAVTSGKVNLTATVENKQLSSTLEGGVLAETSVAFDNAQQTVEINNVVPGDVVTFDIRVHNDSTVSVKYRTIISCESDNGLFAGLRFSIGNEEYAGRTSVSQYETLAVGSEDKIIPVRIALPALTQNQNEYQGKTCTISYKVEAIQGNASIEPTQSNVFEVYNAFDWMSFVKQADAHTLDASIDTVKLINNVNLSGIEYGAYYLELRDDFTIDGNNCSISNLNTTASKDSNRGFDCTGLFAAVQGNNINNVLTVKNLTLKNATVGGAQTALSVSGAFIGHTRSNVIFDNCNVENSSVKNTFAAGFVGYTETLFCNAIELDNCSVANSTFEGNDATAALIAASNAEAIVNDTTVRGNTIKGNDGYSAAALVGTTFGTMTATNVTLQNNTFAINDTNRGYSNCFESDSLGYVFASGAYEVNGTVYCLSAHLYGVLKAGSDVTTHTLNVTLAKNYVVLDDWTPFGFSSYVSDPLLSQITSATLDGGNHTISGLTASLFGPKCSSKISISNLTIQDSRSIGYVDGNNNTYHAGAFIDCADNKMAEIVLNNCHALRVTAQTADQDMPGISAGALIGYIAMTEADDVLSITNCSATDCTVSSVKGNAAGIVGMLSTMPGNNNFKIKNCKVTNCNLTGEKAAKTGAILGTVNNEGVLYMINCSATGCSTGAETNRTPLSTLVGRIVGSNTKVLVSENESGNTYVANGVSLNANGEYEISNAAGLYWFNDQINNHHNSFDSKTLKLTANIDMNGGNWLPAGQNFTSFDYPTIGYADTVEFCGTFDGNGKTISNIEIGMTKEQINALNNTVGENTDKYICSSGFIGFCVDGTIKNLTIDNATVTDSHFVGAIVGYMQTGSVENCHVTSTTITAEHIDDAQCGDKVGGICGLINNRCTINNCSVTNTAITAARDAGTILGCCQSGATQDNVTNCTATNVTLTKDSTCDHSNKGQNMNVSQIGRNATNE